MPLFVVVVDNICVYLRFLSSLWCETAIFQLVVTVASTDSKFVLTNQQVKGMCSTSVLCLMRSSDSQLSALSSVCVRLYVKSFSSRSKS